MDIVFLRSDAEELLDALFLQAAFHDLGDDVFIHRFAGFPALCEDFFSDLLAVFKIPQNTNFTGRR